MDSDSLRSKRIEGHAYSRKIGNAHPCFELHGPVEEMNSFAPRQLVALDAGPCWYLLLHWAVSYQARKWEFVISNSWSFHS